jgi:hypothetical protein
VASSCALLTDASGLPAPAFQAVQRVLNASRSAILAIAVSEDPARGSRHLHRIVVLTGGVVLPGKEWQARARKVRPARREASARRPEGRPARTRQRPCTLLRESSRKGGASNGEVSNSLKSLHLFVTGPGAEHIGAGYVAAYAQALDGRHRPPKRSAVHSGPI